jgi:hypothetical protein
MPTATVVIDRSADKILPTAWGGSGRNYRPGGCFLNAALWYLFLEREFVYVGDTGIVEPSGRVAAWVSTQTCATSTGWLFADAD